MRREHPALGELIKEELIVQDDVIMAQTWKVHIRILDLVIIVLVRNAQVIPSPLGVSVVENLENTIAIYCCISCGDPFLGSL